MSESAAYSHTAECLEASTAADLAWDAYMSICKIRWPYDDPKARQAFAEKEQAATAARERCGCG